MDLTAASLACLQFQVFKKSSRVTKKDESLGTALVGLDNLYLGGQISASEYIM